MRLRMKNLKTMGVYWKIRFLGVRGGGGGVHEKQKKGGGFIKRGGGGGGGGGGVHEKPIYTRELLKKGELDSWRLKGGLGKKEGCGVFERGVDTPMHTMEHKSLVKKL